MKKLHYLTIPIIPVILIIFLFSGCGGGGGEGPAGLPSGAWSVNEGDPVLPASTGYVGSQVCQACHPQIFIDWSHTLHNLMIRKTDQFGATGKSIVADHNSNGIDDFKEGLDFNNPPSSLPSNPFAAYIPNAPVLGYDTGGYFIKIGTVKYYISYTQGGNGIWKQRYFTKIGNSHYILPVQYNEVSKTYSSYSPGNWYDGSNQPRYNNLTPVQNQIISLGRQKDSFERKCAGCHSTGFTLDFKTISGSPGPEYVSGYVELNIGCEACHGPGAQHAATGDPTKIINPEKLIDSDGDTLPDVTGIQRANWICGRCHIRGESAGEFEAGVKFEYPAKVVGGVYMGYAADTIASGGLLLDYYTYSTSPSDYWGYQKIWEGVYGIGLTNVGTYVASKSHHQQFQDVEKGPHNADKTYDAPCFGCHEPHNRNNTHQIKTQITEYDIILNKNVTVSTKEADNSLCLSCHANYGPFQGITKEDVAKISSGVTPANIIEAVMEHMLEEAQMHTEIYNPAGPSKVGRCTSCHAPKAAKSAVSTLDLEGYQVADVTTHTFNIIWPSVPVYTGELVTTACTSCHSSDPAKDAAGGEDTIQIFQWAKSGHADVTQRHWRYAAGPNRPTCVQCHSGKGFVSALATGYSFYYIGKNNTGNVLGLNTDPKIHSCYTCHKGTETAPHARRVIDQVTFPDGTTLSSPDKDNNLCMMCHQGRTSKADVDTYLGSASPPYNFGTVNPHYLAAGSILNGLIGYEYPGKDYSNGKSGIQSHKNTGCKGCHMFNSGNNEVGGHTLRMENAGYINNGPCTGCHGVVITDFHNFRMASDLNDYDGDGVLEGIGKELEDLMNDLIQALQNQGVTKLPSYPYWSNLTTPAQLKAAYNVSLLEHEPGAFVHNYRYAFELLHDSYQDLTGLPHSGVRP